jgi:hypothetical protein
MTTKMSKKTPNRTRAKATARRNTKSGAPASPKRTKLQILVDSLSGPGGATIVELSEVTGWLPHSVRGALAGALRKKGHDIRSEKIDGVRRYTIEGSAA